MIDDDWNQARVHLNNRGLSDHDEPPCVCTVDGSGPCNGLVRCVSLPGLPVQRYSTVLNSHTVNYSTSTRGTVHNTVLVLVQLLSTFLQ